jgi:hypothetical protein
MKNQTIFSRLFAWAVFLSLFLVNIGNLWGASPPETLINAQSRDSLAANRAEESDADWRQDKSEKYKLVEWLIMQNLLAKYQKMEQVENLEDVLD